MKTKFEGLFPFLDPIGRISDKPRSQEYGITDNPLLFTGEAALLLALSKQLTIAEIRKIEMIITQVQIMSGLYRRHPEILQRQYAIPRNAVSHDEYNGICFMVAANPDYLRFYAIGIVEYGERYGWQFNDLSPRENFFEVFKHSPIKTVRQLLAYLKDKAANPQDTNSVDLRHPLHIIALGQWRQPRDRAFYKIAAGRQPTMFEELYLALATVFSSFGDPFKARGGTKLMSWFRMLSIRRLNGESFLLKLAHKIFERNLTKKLGTNYPVTLALAYFDRKETGVSHPLIGMIYDVINLTKK
jgi:hypothetical protein